MLKTFVVIYIALLVPIVVGYIISIYHVIRYRFPENDNSLVVGFLFLFLAGILITSSAVYILGQQTSEPTIIF